MKQCVVRTTCNGNDDLEELLGEGWTVKHISTMCVSSGYTVLEYILEKEISEDA